MARDEELGLLRVPLVGSLRVSSVADAARTKLEEWVEDL